MTQLSEPESHAASLQQNFQNLRFDENSGQIAVGSGIDQRVFKYDIKHEGGILNILPKKEAPRVTARKTPIQSRPRALEHELIGRGTEVQQSIAALESRQSLELYGSAGVGKSSIARHLAYHESTNSTKYFPDGVIYFHLHQQQSLEDLQQWLFEEFYESDRPFKPSVTRTKHDLKNKRALIILDNARLSRQDIEKLQHTAPRCIFLFTSLERSLWGEGKAISVGKLSVEAALLLVKRELEAALKRALQPQEYAAAESLCKAINGYPLEILQQIARACEGTESLMEAAHRVQSTTSSKTRVEQLLCSLNSEQHVVLAALAALGGVALLAEQVSVIANIPNSEPLLQDLCKMDLVQLEESRYQLNAGEQPRYRLSPNLLDILQQQTNLAPYRERAISCFQNWAQQQTDPKILRKESEAISYLLHWAVQAGQWGYVLSLGKLFEGGLALSGDWGLQEKVLQWYLQAAEKLENQTAVAYVLHQLGTRELCLGNIEVGRDLLTQALQLRESLRDQQGAALTRHNLELPLTSKLRLPSFPKGVILPTLITTATILGGSFLGFQLIETRNELSQSQRDLLISQREVKDAQVEVETIKERLERIQTISQNQGTEVTNLQQQITNLQQDLDKAQDELEDANGELETVCKQE